MTLTPQIEADIKYTARVVCGNRSSSAKEKARDVLRELVSISYKYGPLPPRHYGGQRGKLWATYQAVQRGGYDL